jgi:NitT/TauT family transport system substrate-binding protein
MKKIVFYIFVMSLAFCTFCVNAENITIGISYPGPDNIAYLPLDLISKLHIDRQFNVNLNIVHVDGGGIGISKLLSHSVQFASAGLPAVYSQMKNGEKVIAISAISQDPMYVLLVNKTLKKKVKKISDLRGLKIGVNASSITSKTTSQQILDVLLKQNGINQTDVKIVPVSQKWDSQNYLLKFGFIDAILCDEPSASRHLEEDKLFSLFDISNPKDEQLIKGANFLHSTLITRSDLIKDHPEVVNIMVSMLKKSLEYITTHNNDEIAQVLSNDKDVQFKKILTSILNKHKNLYSKDGNFIDQSLAETKIFIENSQDEKNVNFTSIINTDFTQKENKSK